MRIYTTVFFVIQYFVYLMLQGIMQFERVFKNVELFLLIKHFIAKYRHSKMMQKMKMKLGHILVLLLYLFLTYLVVLMNSLQVLCIQNNRYQIFFQISISCYICKQMLILKMFKFYHSAVLSNYLHYYLFVSDIQKALTIVLLNGPNLSV